MAPQRKDVASETLNLGTNQDVQVHMIALLRKVAIEVSEVEAVEAAQEEEAPSTL